MIQNGIRSFLEDVLITIDKIELGKKRLKEELDRTTNDSFRQRLKFEKEYTKEIKKT